MQKLLFTSLFLFSYSLFASSEFIVTKKTGVSKRKSSRALKETIGEQLGDMNNTLVDMVNVFGHLQYRMPMLTSTQTADACLTCFKSHARVTITISELQKHITSLLEKLINNQRPFKKTVKKKLHADHVLLAHYLPQSTHYVEQWRKLFHTMVKKNIPLPGHSFAKIEKLCLLQQEWLLRLQQGLDQSTYLKQS